ncbi:O-antigen ligase family protein [Eionea flava]
MLIYGLKLALFIVFSMACFVAVNHRIFISGFGRQALIFWVSILPFIFLIHNETLTLLVAIPLLVLLNKEHSPVIAIAFFIAIVSAVPDWVEYRMSAPGINHLLVLSFDKVAVLSILCPLLFMAFKQYKISWNLTDGLVLAFVVLTTLLTFREGKFTTVLRYFVDSMLTYAIPYFVMSRIIRTDKDMHYCSLAFVIAAVLLASVFIISQVIKIDIYEALNPRSRYNMLREFRGGFLRLSGPLSGVLVSFLMLAGFLALEMLKKYRFIPLAVYFLLLGAFALSVLFGGSRAGLFGFIMGVGMYFYFLRLQGAQRVICSALLVLFMVLEFTLDITSFFVYEDEYGTFDYRSSLYDTAWLYLQQHPLFGSPFYLTSGYFDHLVTGLGIIDIVSAYLQIALQYGYVGLALFVGIYLSVIIPLLKQVMLGYDPNNDRDRYIIMYLILNVVMAFILVTTSMISLFPIFMMASLALGRSLLVAEPRVPG